jgi:MFS family permease
MWGFALLCGFSYAFITIYNVIGPFLVEHVLNHSAVVYGRIALALGIAWLCGNMIFSRFAKKNKKEALIKITSISIFIVTLIFFICAIIFKLEFTLLVIIPVILFFLAGSFFPYGFGMCLSLFPKMGGTGSAAAGFLYCLIAGATSVLAAFLKAHNMIPLSVSYLILGTLLLVVFLIMQRKALKKN